MRPDFEKLTNILENLVGGIPITDSSDSVINPATAEAQGNWPALEHGQDTVAASGTAEQLNGGTSLSIPDGAELVVTALPDNTGNVYVGGSGVTASNGDVLTPDTSLSLPVTDVSTVYIDVDTAGEGVSWIVEVNN